MKIKRNIILRFSLRLYLVICCLISICLGYAKKLLYSTPLELQAVIVMNNEKKGDGSTIYFNQFDDGSYSIRGLTDGYGELFKLNTDSKIFLEFFDKEDGMVTYLTDIKNGHGTVLMITIHRFDTEWKFRYLTK